VIRVLPGGPERQRRAAPSERDSRRANRAARRCALGRREAGRMLRGRRGRSRITPYFSPEVENFRRNPWPGRE
jgi:hypothetical protein